MTPEPEGGMKTKEQDNPSGLQDTDSTDGLSPLGLDTGA